MTLPVSPLATGTLDLPGGLVQYHSLSRAQASLLRDFKGRPAEAEEFIVAGGTGVSIDEAKAWLEAVDPTTGGELITAILVISGLATAPKAPTSNEPSSEP